MCLSSGLNDDAVGLSPFSVTGFAAGADRLHLVSTNKRTSNYVLKIMATFPISFQPLKHIIYLLMISNYSSKLTLFLTASSPSPISILSVTRLNVKHLNLFFLV